MRIIKLKYEITHINKEMASVIFFFYVQEIKIVTYKTKFRDNKKIVIKYIEKSMILFLISLGKYR